MAKKRVAFFEIEKWEEKYVKENLKGAELIFDQGKLTAKKAEKIKDVTALAVFIYSPISKEILDKMPKLKLVTTMSTGYDHIDLEECKKRGITVCNVPTYGENTVAEHTFALILAISRKINAACQAGKCMLVDYKQLRGFDLKDKTLGVVGYGNIGEHVVRIARGFGMKVLVYDIKKDMKEAKKMGFKYAGFENLLKKSDIITFHVPLNKYTHHMLNKKNIKMIKEGAVVINTARGGIIETEALIWALEKKRLGGAGLDVLEGEKELKEEKQLLSEQFSEEAMKTLIENHVLMNYPNVLITPHNAFNSKEALLRIVETTINNVKGFLKGKKVNTVKK